MKKTNKGFSMVELIIVIAIMAILAGALAPALIKYINKSRISTDISNAQQIASGIQTALSDETAYGECSETGNTIVSYADFVRGNSGTAMETQLKSVIGDIDGSMKSKKDANSTSLADSDRNFSVKVSVNGNTVEVYGGGTDGNHQMYPSTGASWVTK